MRLLLDSHVALWWLDANAAMGPTSRTLIEQADEVYVSVVSRGNSGSSGRSGS